MEIKILGSGSSGNCYLLKAEKGTLVLEAGVRLPLVLNECSYREICGVLISHSHGDHCGYASQFLKRRIPVYMSEECRDSKKEWEESKLYQPFSKIEIGEFSILAFPLLHDAPNFGFLIGCKEDDGSLLYITDTRTMGDGKRKYSFQGVTNVMIEADYDNDILSLNLKKGVLNGFLAKRIQMTHMSIKNSIEAVKTLEIPRLRNIVLVHLSQNNANSEDFRLRMTRATGVNTVVAEPGLTIQTNKPF